MNLIQNIYNKNGKKIYTYIFFFISHSLIRLSHNLNGLWRNEPILEFMAHLQLMVAFMRYLNYFKYLNILIAIRLLGFIKSVFPFIKGNQDVKYLLVLVLVQTPALVNGSKSQYNELQYPILLIKIYLFLEHYFSFILLFKSKTS